MRIDIDVLASVMDQSGLRGRVYCRSLARAPWGLEFDGGPDGGGLFHLVVSARNLVFDAILISNTCANVMKHASAIQTDHVARPVGKRRPTQRSQAWFRLVVWGSGVALMEIDNQSG